MGQVNIFQIPTQKRDSFLQMVSGGYDKAKMEKSINKNSVTYHLSFYYKNRTTPNDISWAWVFDEYNLNSPTTTGSPKGIIVITSQDDKPIYAVTFGTAFFSVDKYCNRDFGFDYACRVPYSDIKLTALTNPVAVRNKTINSYQNYDKLDFSSGESFAKIKAKTDITNEVDFLKETIEVGTAIKFQLRNNSLDNIIDLIIHIELVLQKQKKTSIPRFCLVKDSDRLARLQNNLIEAITNHSPHVLISEFCIIGSLEVFNRCDAYRLLYKHKKDDYSELTLQNIINFCNKYNLLGAEEMFKVKVQFVEDGNPRHSANLMSIFDYMDEEEKCLLDHGDWFEFNDDYLSYLKDSLKEIPVSYEPRYDLLQSSLDAFHNDRFEQERILPEYQGKTPEEIKEKIVRKYYREYAFNIMREMNDHFVLWDRKTVPIGKESIEVADLYQGERIFSVKCGNSSSELTYVVDQSSMALDAYKHGLLPQVSTIQKVIIWLVLDRRTHVPMDGISLDWDKLNMLVLKNRLDLWKKEVRLAGLQPEIWINYKTKD